jgi:NAD(P)H-flavin reductase
MLGLDVPRDIWAAHREVAQYVDLVLPGIAPWRATIASRPGRERFDFLVKDAGARSHRVALLAPGDQIGITLPAGDGFPINAYRRMDVMLIACGVAVCAMRAVIEEILLARLEWHKVGLFYGERTSDRFAFVEERERWREADINVHMVASRPSQGTSWSGKSGYVQDVILEMEPELRETVAFIAGKDQMVNDTITVLERLGMASNMIVLNI